MEKLRTAKVFEGDCIKHLNELDAVIHLTFFDPPYRQGKEYRFFDDNQSDKKYWSWIKEVTSRVYDLTAEGGCIYFMQREKNAGAVLEALREAGWTFQNLIIWKKRASAIPSNYRFSKQYQIIAFATKGRKPRLFNKLRINYPLLPEYKHKRKNGIYVTDVWDDIRELTSGYFAGDEAIRDGKGKRIHKQQSPIALLLRIILSSTMMGDTVLDPVAGTGTTLVVASQLGRSYIGVEIDPENVRTIKNRLGSMRPSDKLSSYRDYYGFTPNLDTIWRLEDAAKQRKLPNE